MMGRRNRVRIPECVVRFIRSISPSDDGQYTGHRDAEGDDCDDNNNDDDDDLVNSSFQEIEDEASPKIVDFEGGQRIRLSLHSRAVIIMQNTFVRLFLSHRLKDGRCLITRSY